MMNITYDEKNKIFHLCNEKISYVIGVLPNGHLGHFYFGKKLYGNLTEEMFIRRQYKSLTNYIGGYENLSLNTELCEYPTFGTTDLREPALMTKSENGSIITNFEFVDYDINKGKSNSDSLPHTFANNDQALTLDITLMDKTLSVKLVHTYTVFKNTNVVVRKTKMLNNGSPISITKIMSMSMDLSSNYSDWVQLSGDWARERHMVKRILDHGITKIESKAGSSGAIHNPGVVLTTPNTDESTGEAIGVNLVYSGNFEISAERDQNDVLRVMAGINQFMFDWTLMKGESFETPEVVLAYSKEGLNDLSHTYHTFFRHHLIHPKWINERKPILINNWEATYFDFDEYKIIEIAQKAKEVGIDLFVLDDGWFGNRNNDKEALGDWAVNKEKIPNGIDGLCKRINEIGLDFGIWIEPEMVSENSNLYRKHPDYIIGEPGRPSSKGRHQLMLDFSRPIVVDEIFNQLIQTFDGVNIRYIKWDMNRTITEPFSIGLSKTSQGEFYHRYILGVYDLYRRLSNRYPNILFESCSAGGNRFDAGMLFFAPQTWTSDNTDAVERLKIQYGTSLFYPLYSMGSHISDIPNHQTYRNTTYKFRNDVAMFGTYGFELDLNRLSDEEIKSTIEYVEQFKLKQQLIHNGRFYRIESPFTGNTTAWSVVNEDQTECLVGFYQVLARPNQGIQRLQLKGLDDSRLYEVKSSLYNGTVSGSYLMNHGIIFTPSSNGYSINRQTVGDFQSYLIHVNAK